MMHKKNEHDVFKLTPGSCQGSPTPFRKGVGNGNQNDPEVVPKKKRRYYTANYKLRILQEADECTSQGQFGALLRREGLYHSNIKRWREQRDQGILQGLSQKRGPKKSDNDQEQRRIQELERENAKLKIELQKAETIIEFQKKISELLDKPKDSKNGKTL